MANCQNLFEKFLDKLDIIDSKTEKMRKSKDNLISRIENYFESNHPDYTPSFFIQGSYKMGTSIRTKDDECDLDLGVYLTPKPDVTAITVQQWVYDAVNGITDATPTKKNKCIRIQYSAGYHIDLPVYVNEKNSNKVPELVIKSKGFERSDARGVINWFKDAKKDNPQLVRIVKYLKAWADKVRTSMPPGLAWTILAVSNLKKKPERDDIALRDTMKAILSTLKQKFECKVPAEPYDDMFSDYSEEKKREIKEAMQKFIDEASAAINEPNEKKSSHTWQQLLGSRFPEGEDKEDSTLSKLNSLKDSILSKSARLSSSGILGTFANGVSAASHTNFGD